MTKPDTWMPLYVAEWDADTAHLDCEQDGAYGRMIRWYWRHGPLPDDDNMIARIIRMDVRRWQKLRLVLAPFFTIERGSWRNKRCDQERERAAKISSIRADAGARGGRPRKQTESSGESKTESNEKPNAKANGNQTRKQNGLQTETHANVARPSPAELEEPLRSSSNISTSGSADERAGGSSSAPLGGGGWDTDDTEDGWLKAANRADQEELRCRRSDPDHASELAEFIAFARARAAELKRERLARDFAERAA